MFVNTSTHEITRITMPKPITIDIRPDIFSPIECRFTIPFSLEIKEEYPYWFNLLAQEVRRCFTAYESKYLIKYLEGSEPDCSPEFQNADVAKANIKEFVRRLLDNGVAGHLRHAIGEGCNQMERLKSLHDYCCKFDLEEFCSYLAYWAPSIADYWDISKEHYAKFVSNGFTWEEVFLMKAINNINELDLERAVHEHLNNMRTKEIDISKRVIRAAESKITVNSEVANARTQQATRLQEEGRCTYCKKKGHREIVCRIKRRRVSSGSRHMYSQ